MELGQFSFGVGDRFGQEGRAQLAAFVEARRRGVTITPVWNKSNREHLIVKTDPAAVRAEADAAVAALGWREPYFVDADHIGLSTVDRFLTPCDFFTIDVADFIHRPPVDAALGEFVRANRKLCGAPAIADLSAPLRLDEALLIKIGQQYLAAVQEAGRVYRRIAAARGAGRAIIEVSMDETEQPQTPAELLLILAALSAEQVPLQTIAPKFTGRFNKGVDYLGDVRQLEKEFNDDLAIIAWAVPRFGLPKNLKLSVHSGSDKFSIYRPLRRCLEKHGAGVHVKTAGTTWLEEVAAVAKADADGLAFVREIYAEALTRLDELCAPYAAVIDIQRQRLPGAATVAGWSGADFAAAIRHEPGAPAFNADLRQLLHVSYKLAAQRKDRWENLLQRHADAIGRQVTHNLFERHLRPLFL